MGILLVGPLQQLVRYLKTGLYREDKTDWLEVVFMMGILFYSVMLLVSNTYNPFIYFRF